MSKRRNRKRYKLAHPFVLFYLTVFLAVIFVSVYYVLPRSLEKQNAYRMVQKFADLPITAQAVYVYDDTDHKLIWAHNAYKSLPLASITKLMTTLCTVEHMSTESVVAVDQNILLATTTVQTPEPQEEVKLHDLIAFTLVRSSNEGAESMAEYVGGNKSMLDCMNTRARELGMNHTFYGNTTGLDVDVGKAGDFGSARDVYKLFSYMLPRYYDILKLTALDRFSLTADSGTMYTAYNTNIALQNIPHIVASKTGYTDTAGGNLAFAMEPSPGRLIYVVILGSTWDGRFDDAKKLAELINELYDNN